MSLGNSPVDEAVLTLAWGPDFSILLSLSSICVSVQLMLFLLDSWVWSHFLRHLLGLSSIDGTISFHTCCLNLLATFLFYDQPTSEGFWPELHPGPCCHVLRWTYLASTCAVVVSWRSSTSSSLQIITPELIFGPWASFSAGWGWRRLNSQLWCSFPGFAVVLQDKHKNFRGYHIN